MPILTLHREPARQAYFAGPERRPVFFDPGLNCWVVSDRDDAEAVLQSRSFQVVALSEVYETFQGPSGRTFPNLIFALRHIPVGLNDEAHRDMRRRIAELVARRRGAIAGAIPALVEQWIGPIEERDEVELIGEALSPLVTAFVGVLTETTIPDLHACRRVSMIFDRMIGLRTRRALEDEVGVVRALIRASIGSDAPEVEEGLRLALFALGNDSLVGTIGESLYRILDEHPGVPFQAIPFPDMPVETGVPFFERVVADAVAIGGVRLSPGERVRVLMQGFAYSPDPLDRARIFGAGVHACLGRQMSVDLWREVVRRLARMRVSAEVVDHALRDDNYVFTCPAKIVLRIAR